MNHAEIVRKLIGEINPVGAAHIDPDRLENLKQMCTLIEHLIADITHVAVHYDDRYEASVKTSCEYAESFLSTLGIKLK